MTSSDHQRLLDYFSWNSCVSDERKLLYIATPKVACTSLKWWFAELEGVAEAVKQLKISSETDPELVIHDTLLAVAPQLLVRSPEQLEHVRREGYFSFALVRNPYKRIFSAWQSKILLREPLQVEPYEGQAFVDLPVETLSDVTASFECFLEFLFANERNDFKDAHWTPQYDLLQPDAFSYSAVSKIEDTAALNAALRSHLGEPYISPFSKARANESLIPYLPEFISPRSKSLIDELYAKDFEFYDYPTSIPPAKEAFSQEQLTVALKGIELLRGRHQRIGEMRRYFIEQISGLLKDKEWLAEQRLTWMDFGKSKEDQLFALQASFSEYAGQLEADRNEHQQLRVELEQSKVEAEISKKELDQSRIELDELKVGLEQARVEHERTKVECEQARVELAQLRTDFHQLKLLREQAQFDHEHAKAEHELTKGEHERTKGEHERTKVAHEQTSVELAQLSADFSQLKLLLDHSQVDLEHTKGEHERTKVAHEQTKVESAQLRAELEQSRLEVASLVSEREAFALKHKRYLTSYKYIDAEIVARLRRTVHIMKRRKGD
ncbi:sulfotransferase family 2 domain-containing protein [Pseudomonas sp. HS6]|uniref:sulfotransferase family 2 domain-containing protein n=1 Tax=Pseudomonas sp. HS6 TaxID=2850559 RepID=UPI00201988C5|nr:sulfotransferase family 2 domain-containing protein [Pseudomonas sp. HS6]UQS13055.1 sulfotransferase family 2 domain-containing protein [Pseudomonas sp. HS6]